MPPHGTRITLLLLALLWGLPSPSRAASSAEVARIKALQKHLLLSEPAERLEKLERADRLRKRSRLAPGKAIEKSRKARVGARRRTAPPGDLREASQSQTARRVAESQGLLGIATPPNQLMNDPSGEPNGSCQSEVSIAAFGDHMVAAWNDGIGVYGSPWPNDTQGWGYSADGGATWTDGGPVPNAGLFTWSSDPVVVVNEKTGTFYYSGLYDAPGRNGIAVIEGKFCGTGFNWGTPRIVTEVSNSSGLLDKEWLAVDSLSGNLYVSWSNFISSGGQFVTNRIEFARSTDGNQTWSTPQVLSSTIDAGLVQGSRPAVGPNGEIFVVWHAIGQSSGPYANSPFGRDFLRVRKSANFGQSFGSQVTADSVFSNFGNGAPGFNRGLGITFPGIAVDRTQGPRSGRVYVTWNESINFYNDDFPEPGLSPARSEVENNNGTATATSFTPGEILRGTISVTGNPGDLDYWKWNAVQGQTAIFYLDSLDSNLDAAFRIFCTDGTTLLAFSQNGTGNIGLLVFTAPTTGTYYMRMASYGGAHTGRYRILTTLNTPQSERARDHRDVFVKSSADGASWGSTTRVNDSPPYLDDWLPEVQVDGLGRVFVAAFDFRDSPALCNAGSNVYLYRSDNGGASWFSGTSMSSAISNWSATYSTLIPNHGDYIGLFARDSVAFVAWGDGRGNDPDVYMVRTGNPFACVPSPVCVVDSSATATSVSITWSAPAGFTADVLRISAGSTVNLGPVVADAGNRIVFQDTNLSGGRYVYVLDAPGYCESLLGAVSISPVCNEAPVTVQGAQATTSSVTVTWNAPQGLAARVERRTGNGPFVDQGAVTADSFDHIVFQDLAVTPGVTYTYRLVVQGFCTPSAGEVTVTVPGIALAIGGVSPNPALHDVNVTFVLPTAGPAFLELLDVGGRKIHRIEVGELGAGTHQVNLTQGVDVKPGLYFVRLAQDGREVVKRVSIVSP